MSLHKEVHLEAEICEHLAAHDWHYAEGDAAHYDRALALYPPDVLAWVQGTQPKAWEALSKSHGDQAGKVLLERLRNRIDAQGTLHVLRHGIDMLGLRGKLELVQFKPALAMNPELTAKYKANHLRVVRQVHYSQHNENSIDLVLFLNGLPVATVELKSDFTQSVGDAVDQYRFDRHPKPKGQPAEPLLGFPSGALVHFAVSNTEVQMTTKLEGAATRFLPFNKGYEGGAGNVPDGNTLIHDAPPAGHPTAYLWEEVWERESWLEILGRYLVAERDKKKQLKSVIFPRFHQLQATRKLVAAALAEGAGHKYLTHADLESGVKATPTGVHPTGIDLFGLAHFHAVVLRLPCIDGVLAYALLPGHIVGRPARLNLLQRSDDLRLRMPASAHSSFPFPSSKSYSEMDGFWGSGHNRHPAPPDRHIPGPLPVQVPMLPARFLITQ